MSVYEPFDGPMNSIEISTEGGGGGYDDDDEEDDDVVWIWRRKMRLRILRKVPWFNLLSIHKGYNSGEK